MPLSGFIVDIACDRNVHPSEEECSHCPTCILMPTMAILSKISSHPSLLQCARGSDFANEFVYKFTTTALAPSSLNPIGGSFLSCSISDVMSNVQHSGKMKILETLLDSFCSNMSKTLLFSYSTKTLSVIEKYVKARGWRYCRLDGSTMVKKRQCLVDEFNADKTMLLFLISTKAGGVGLNLTSANKVIIFDCNWNPAYDAQAQDRAYRLGQTKHVTVYRLIAQGTIEEMAYMRQKYKQVLQRAAVGSGSSNMTGGNDMGRGSFEGIQGHSDARGELFGAENMLNYVDGSFLIQLRNDYEAKQGIRNNLENDNPVLISKKKRGSVDVGKLVTLNEKSADELVSIFANKEIMKVDVK